MGNKYVVEIWMKDFRGKWCYVEKYNGQYLIVVIFKMIKEKIDGAECIQFKWR